MFLLLLGAVKTLVLLTFHSPESKIAAATVKAGVVKEIPPSTLMRIEVPGIFLCCFGGALAIVFAERIAGDPLGTLICAGLACYFALGVWALTTKRNDPRPLLSVDVLVQFAPGACFLLAAISAIAI